MGPAATAADLVPRQEHAIIMKALRDVEGKECRGLDAPSTAQMRRKCC